MASPKAPDGYILTRHEGYFLNAKGFRAEDGDESRWAPAQTFLVPHFDEERPFDGANSPNCVLRSIENGWVPPVYTLTHKDDPTPKVEPASVLTGKEDADVAN